MPSSYQQIENKQITGKNTQERLNNPYVNLLIFYWKYAMGLCQVALKHLNRKSLASLGSSKSQEKLLPLLRSTHAEDTDVPCSIGIVVLTCPGAEQDFIDAVARKPVAPNFFKSKHLLHSSPNV